MSQCYSPSPNPRSVCAIPWRCATWLHSVISRCRLSYCGRGGLVIHLSAQVVRVWPPPCASRRDFALIHCVCGCSWPHRTPGTAHVWLRDKRPVGAMQNRLRGSCGWWISGTPASSCAFDNDRTAGHRDASSSAHQCSDCTAVPFVACCLPRPWRL